MIIYFLRHANAGDTKKDPQRDEQRSLDREGIEQCYTVARFFAKLNVVPDLILSSPLKRAAQTASLVANELGYDDRMKLVKALRPEAAYADFRPMLKSHVHAENVIVVGHNPNLSHFIGHIICEAGQRAEVDIKKAGVARVDFDGKRGELQWMITPKMLREMAKLDPKELKKPEHKPPSVAEKKTDGKHAPKKGARKAKKRGAKKPKRSAKKQKKK